MHKAPPGWQLAPLGELAEIRSSQVDKKSRDGEVPVRLCNYRDVYQHDQITDQLDFMQATARSADISRFSLQAGDVLLTKDSESPHDIGVSAYVPTSLPGVLCGYHLTLLRPDTSQLLGAYLHQYLGLQMVRNYFYLCAQGITRFGLTKPVLHALPVMYPALAQQRQLVERLGSVDHLIGLHQAILRQLRTLRSGLMQTHIGLGEGSAGSDDAGASVSDRSLRRLGDSLMLAYGKPCPEPIQPYGRYPVVGAGGVIGYTNRYFVSSPSVVIGRKGTIHQPTYVEQKCWPIDTAYYVREYRDMCPRWLYYLLMSLNLSAYNEATGVPSLSRNTFYRIPYRHPSLCEQRQVAAALSAVDQQYAARQACLQGYRRLKHAVLHDLIAV
ncbi:MAG: restriction endonuclease subunit S [Pseudomonadota bacterium]